MGEVGEGGVIQQSHSSFAWSEEEVGVILAKWGQEEKPAEPEQQTGPEPRIQLRVLPVLLRAMESDRGFKGGEGEGASTVTRLTAVGEWLAGDQPASWPLLPSRWPPGVWNVTGGEGMEERISSWRSGVNNNVVHWDKELKRRASLGANGKGQPLLQVLSSGL